MTTKKRTGVRFAGTRVALVAASAISFLGIWVQLTRAGTPTEDELVAPSREPVAQVLGPVVAPPSIQSADNSVRRPEPTPVPRRSVSRGS